MERPKNYLRVAVALVGVLLAGTALGQGTAPAPVDRQSPFYGMPDSPGAAKLAPVTPPPLPTAAAKLPLDKLHVPAGFKVEVFASGMASARSMALAPTAPSSSVPDWWTRSTPSPR